MRESPHTHFIQHDIAYLEVESGNYNRSVPNIVRMTSNEFDSAEHYKIC